MYLLQLFNISINCASHDHIPRPQKNSVYVYQCISYTKIYLVRDRARISQLLPIRQRAVVENKSVLKLINNTTTHIYF